MGIKLITPPGMLVTVAFLAVYCAYSSWMALVEHSWVCAIVASISIAACIGTAMLQPWSRYLVYLLTIDFVIVWGHSVYIGVKAGFFDFFFSSPLAAVWSIAPELVLVVLALICSCFVFRHFRRESQLASAN